MSEHIPFKRVRGRNRIDVRDPDDVRIWAMSLGVSEKELRAAIEATGEDVDNVRKYLHLPH